MLKFSQKYTKEYLDRQVLFCFNCYEKYGKSKRSMWLIGTNGISETNCKHCGQPTNNSGLSFYEICVIERINDSWPFYKAMIDLKQNDIITFYQKITEFENQIEQREAVEEEKQSAPTTQPQPTTPPLPTCPRCGSTSITTGARGVSGFWGFIGASKTVNRCANCGHTWTPKG